MNILLICNAGMSTSILVKKMEAEATNRSLDCKIWALSTTEAKQQSDAIDVILLGPQIKFAMNEMKEAFPNIPIDVIDRRVYGMVDGKGALDQALALL